MKINCDEFNLIREAEYEPEVDMLRVVILCNPSDLPVEANDPGSVSSGSSPIEHELGRLYELLAILTRNVTIGGLRS